MNLTMFILKTLFVLTIFSEHHFYPESEVQVPFPAFVRVELGSPLNRTEILVQELDGQKTTVLTFEMLESKIQSQRSNTWSISKDTPCISGSDMLWFCCQGMEPYGIPCLDFFQTKRHQIPCRITQKIAVPVQKFFNRCTRNIQSGHILFWNQNSLSDYQFSASFKKGEEIKLEVCSDELYGFVSICLENEHLLIFQGTLLLDKNGQLVITSRSDYQDVDFQDVDFESLHLYKINRGFGNSFYIPPERLKSMESTFNFTLCVSDGNQLSCSHGLFDFPSTVWFYVRDDKGKEVLYKLYANGYFKKTVLPE